MRAIFLICACLCAGFNSVQGATVQVAAPIDRPPPDYPDAAGTAEGYVKLHFTIAKDGHVIDASVLESNPPGLFDTAAVAGLKQWSYRPRLIDGRPADQPDNVIMVRFKPPADTGPVWLNPEPPMYPREAFAAKIEGRVKVGFDITDTGITTNVHVLDTTAPGVFDAVAIESVDQRIYQTAIVDGHNQGVTGQTAMLVYKLAEARVRPKPIYIVKPEYPQDAAMSRINGFCDIVMTLAEDGSVSDAVLQTSFPRGVFDRSCMRVIKFWRFETAETLGVPVPQRMHYRMSYRISSANANDLHYLKPGQWVVLDYTLATDGHPKDIKVAEQSEPGLPVAKAVKQLQDTKLSPVTENGVPVEKQHLRIKID
jgi:TonB family protein